MELWLIETNKDTDVPEEVAVQVSESEVLGVLQDKLKTYFYEAEKELGITEVEHKPGLFKKKEILEYENGFEAKEAAEVAYRALVAGFKTVKAIAKVRRKP